MISILEDHQDWLKCKCSDCGLVFESHPDKDIAVIWDVLRRVVITVCPDCTGQTKTINKVEKTEEKIYTYRVLFSENTREAILCYLGTKEYKVDGNTVSVALTTDDVFELVKIGAEVKPGTGSV